jgi:hypothetical protein
MLINLKIKSIIYILIYKQPEWEQLVAVQIKKSLDSLFKPIGRVSKLEEAVVGLIILLN